MDGLGKDSSLMRIQYLSLTVKRARKHEKSMAGDYGPTIEDDKPYEKLREVGRARCTGQEAQPRVGSLNDQLIQSSILR